MGFLKKIWQNRSSEYPNRRRLTATGTPETYDVAREEGLIFEEGDAFDQSNMNDLESRIQTAVEEVSTAAAAAQTTANSKADTSAFSAHTGNGTMHITAAERTAWNGKAAGTHTHAASQVTAGTLAGIVTANSNTAYTTGQVRNIMQSTAAPSGGNNGDVWHQYK